MTAMIGAYVEEFLYKIPQEYRLDIETTLNPNISEPLFSYSIMRWTFRIFPIALLILLIGIADCLRKNKKDMRTWIGKLLTSAAVISLVLILILVIGAEQFTAVFINGVLTSDQGSFGTLLLIVLQSVTYQSLLWMGGIAIGFLCIGLLILFLNKREKENQEQNTFEEPTQEIMDAKQAMIEDMDTDSSESEEGL